MHFKAAIPDDLDILPEHGVRQYIELFAAAHQITFERTRLDDWAEAVTRAAGDDLALDSNEASGRTEATKVDQWPASGTALDEPLQRTRTNERAQSGVAPHLVSVRLRQHMTAPRRSAVWDIGSTATIAADGCRSLGCEPFRCGHNFP